MRKRRGNTSLVIVRVREDAPFDVCRVRRAGVGRNRPGSHSRTDTCEHRPSEAVPVSYWREYACGRSWVSTASRTASQAGEQPHLKDVPVQTAELSLPSHQVVQLLAGVLVRVGRHLQVDGALHPQEPDSKRTW